MKCINCDKENLSYSRYCNECLDKAEKKTTKQILKAFAVGFAIVGVIGYLYISGR